MRKPSSLIVTIAVILITLLVPIGILTQAGLQDRQGDHGRERASVVVLPTYRFRFEPGRKRIPITLVNQTQEELRYAHGSPFRFFYFLVERPNGSLIHKAMRDDLAPLRPGDVRVLRPGESDTQLLDLSHWYVTDEYQDPFSLTPGTYILKTAYQPHDAGVGLTEVRTEMQPAAVIIIEDPKDDGDEDEE